MDQRALARSTSFSTSQTIRALEDGRGHDDLALRHLIRISDALGVEPALLFDRPEGAAPTADDITLEAALAQTGRWIERDDLAATLGWKLERLATAAETLRARLAATGQRLVTRNGRLRLIPAEGVLTSNQTQAVEALKIAERGPNLATGRVLADAVAGRIDERWQATATNSQLVEQARLLKLGWIEPDRVSRGPLSQDAVLGRGDGPASWRDHGSTHRSCSTGASGWRWRASGRSRTSLLISGSTRRC